MFFLQNITFEEIIKKSSFLEHPKFVMCSQGNETVASYECIRLI